MYLSVPLSQLLTRSTESVELQPDRRYKQVTVRLWGQGVVERNEVGGSEIAGTRRFVVRPGQFILSRIDARNGALGIVPAALDGAVVSNDFPSFLVNETRLLPAYLGWLTRTSDFVDLCRAASAGTTNRVRLDESRFLDMEIPLPPLAEQRRIVARIEALAAQINEARGLRREAVAETEALIASESDRLIGKIADQHGTTPFNSFSPHVTSGPRNWGAKYSDHGIRFYRAQDIGPNGKILENSKAFIIPPDTNQGKSAQLQHGDLMIVITGATVGRCSVFSEHLEPGYISQHVALCRLPKEKIDPYFGLWNLRSPRGQQQLLGQRYGQGKPGLNLTNIRLLSIPIVPLPEQRRIVAYLDALQAKVDALKALQAETAAELDALLPAVLDRAFKGEL